jgi:hypothetical protein
VCLVPMLHVVCLSGTTCAAGAWDVERLRQFHLCLMWTSHLMICIQKAWRFLRCKFDTCKASGCRGLQSLLSVCRRVDQVSVSIWTLGSSDACTVAS